MKSFYLLKKTGIFFICCLLAMNVFGQTAQIINPSGGASSLLNDGLKIVANTNGSLSVYRENQTQYYSGYTWPDGQGSGVTLTFRFSQGSTYNTSSCLFTVCATTTAIQSGNDWTTSITGYVTSSISGQKFYVTMNFSYTHPNNFFYVDYWVRAPYAPAYTTAETVHLYLYHDAFILGSDASKGCRIVNGTGELIGNYRLVTDVASNCTSNRAKNMHSPSHHGFKTGAFRSYSTGTLGQQTNVDATNMLSNLVGNTCLDDGIGAEFTVGPLSNGQTGVARVMHGYGNSMGEFDAVPVINPTVAPGSSAPVTINFTSPTYSEPEGSNSHAASAIQITVGGGMLAQAQVCNFTVSGGTAVQNTHYSYVKGFTIPAGNYTTPQTLTLNNFTIIGDTLCSTTTNLNFNITIDSDVCNDLIGRGSNYTTTVTIQNDDPVPTANQPLSDTVCPGTSRPATTWVFTGTVPGTTYEWSATNATAIGLPTTSGTANMPAFTAVNTTTAQITSTVTITPKQGTCTGSTKTFTITVPTITTITTHPSTAVPVSKTYNSGTFSTLTVAATGTGLTYQWYRNTTASNSGGTLISGATSASYSPVSTLTAGDYYYYCIVTGACGAVPSNVSGKHTIIIQLDVYTACPGVSLTFTASPLNGGSNPTYQWKKNGVIIPGATNSTYTYVPANGDTITCDMTSDANCADPLVVTSGKIIALHSPFVITLQASAICVGTTTQLHSTVSGTWTSTNPTAATVTSSGLVTGLATGSTKFVFTSSATGCTDTTTTLTVGNFPTVNPISAIANSVCVNGYIQLSNTTTGGVWSLSNNNAQITNSNTSNPVLIEGKITGQVYVTYTVGTAPCQSSETFLLKVLPASPPKITIGFEH